MLLTRVYLVGCLAGAFSQIFFAFASVFVGVLFVSCPCSQRLSCNLAIFFCSMVVLDLDAYSLFVGAWNYISGNGQNR